MISDLKTEIEKVVMPILTEQLFDLVELKLSRYKKNFRLQVFIDSDDGVRVDDCARFSGLIGTALDLTDMMEEGYILEVSSPGVDRPLKTEADFRRRVGRNLQIEMVEEGHTKTVRGLLEEIDNGSLLLTGKKGKTKIAMADIMQGKEII